MRRNPRGLRLSDRSTTFEPSQHSPRDRAWPIGEANTSVGGGHDRPLGATNGRAQRRSIRHPRHHGNQSSLVDIRLASAFYTPAAGPGHATFERPPESLPTQLWLGPVLRERPMTQLEFCQEQDGEVIAQAHARSITSIPISGDRVFLPAEHQSCVYVHVKVSSRRFYYDQQGHLALVRLSCRVLVDEEKVLSDDGTISVQGQLPVTTVFDLGHENDEVPRSVPSFFCPRCECSMTRHQPDPRLPNCLLATCDDCASWFITNPSGTDLRLIREPRSGCAVVSGQVSVSRLPRWFQS